jgi:hypothetical protein
VRNVLRGTYNRGRNAACLTKAEDTRRAHVILLCVW